MNFVQSIEINSKEFGSVCKTILEKKLNDSEVGKEITKVEVIDTSTETELAGTTVCYDLRLLVIIFRVFEIHIYFIGRRNKKN